MKQHFDLNEMTINREILPNYRDDLEHHIKDLFIWALGESAITEMTGTVRDNDPNKMDINQLYSLFRLHSIPKRNKFHSRADFFGITRKKTGNGGRRVFKDITSGKELRVRKCDTSRINSIKISIRDRWINWRLRIKKENSNSDMTIETQTALLHEHMYDRLNDSNNPSDAKRKRLNMYRNDRTKENGQTNPIWI